MIHWFDLFVAFFLITSATWSYFRGFTKEAFSVFALVAGYFTASRLYQPLGPLFESLHPEKTAQEIFSFLSLFFVAVIVVVIISIYIRRILKLSDVLSSADRVAGFAVGIFKGGLILAILAYPFTLAPGVREEALKGSITAPVLISLSGVMLENFAPGLATDIEKVKGDTKEVKKSSDTIERYRKKLEKINIGDMIKGKEGGETKLEEETASRPVDSIDEKDRAELEKILEKVDR